MGINNDIFQNSLEQGHTAAWDQEWDLAINLYMQALEEKPNDPIALANLGLALFEVGNYVESLKYYKKVAEFTQEDPIPFEKISHLYEYLGDNDSAVENAWKAAELYLGNRDVVKASDNYSRLLRLEPGNIKAHSRQALIYKHIGRKKEAIDEFLIIARLFQDKDDIENAEKAIQQALEFDSQSRDAQQAMDYLHESKPIPMPEKPDVSTRLWTDHAEESVEISGDEMISELNPVDKAFQNAIADLAGLLIDGQFDNKKQYQSERSGGIDLEKQREQISEQIDQDRLMFHLNKAMELQTQGANSQATRELSRAIGYGLEYPAGYFVAGNLFLNDGQWESSYSALKKAVIHPDYILASRMLLGQTLRRMGRVQESAVEYLRALEVAENAVLTEGDGEVLDFSYDPIVDAISEQTDNETLQGIIENIEVLLYRADWRGAIRRARSQLAEQHFGLPLFTLANEWIQSEDSRITQALNYIAKLDQSGYIDTAMEEALYAIQISPTYLPLHLYIGELLLKQGLFEEAVDKFTSIADTYKASGESQQAIALYRRSISLTPMDAKLRENVIYQLTDLGLIDDVLKEYVELAELYYGLADLEKTRNTYDQALQLAYRSSDPLSWQVRLLTRMADIDMQSLDWRQALQVNEEIRNLQPNFVEARIKIIDLTYRIGQSEKASLELDSLLIDFEGEEQREKAIKIVNEIIEGNQGKADLRKRLADLYKDDGQLSEAIEQLDEAGEILLNAGDKEGAAKYIEEILALKPKNASEYEILLSQIKGEE